MQSQQYRVAYSEPGSSSSTSSSVSYDYSGLDEIRKRQNEANQMAVARQAQLYDGDIKGSMAGGQRIRYLLSSLKDIEPVRVSSVSNSNRSDYNGGAIDQHTAETPEAPITATPAPANAVFGAPARRPTKQAPEGKPEFGLA